jgi:hypothetical protein
MHQASTRAWFVGHVYVYCADAVAAAAAAFPVPPPCRLLRGVSVRISGCVDDGLSGPGSIGITTTTNSDGIAYFKQHAENSIQYCWGTCQPQGTARQACTCRQQVESP